MLESYSGILYLILGIALVWMVLKFLLRIAFKIFSIGCGLILLFGAVLVVLRFIDVF